MRPDAVTKPLAVYVHWPFCAKKCPYCDFNSHVRDEVDHGAWRDALLAELAYMHGLVPEREVISIFFGGGTPSLMDPRTAAAVIEAVKDRWAVAQDLEITLEANPTSVEADKFQAFSQAGINRVSLGVQSLDDQVLEFLGRTHNAAEARQAIEVAAAAFRRFSFDLIYARPKQSLKSWRAELEDALSYGTEHLSLYQLTIEPGTAFYTQYQRGAFDLPDDRLAADLFDLTQDVLTKAGLPAYEISNHAKKGAESRHNLSYWRYYDYIGIGPGAHGRVTVGGQKYGTRTHRAPEIWLEKVQAKGHAVHPHEQISKAQALTESLMMGLRLYEGLNISSLEDMSGHAFDDLVERRKRQALIEEGLWIETPDLIKVTPEGMRRLDGILGWLLA